MATGELLGGLLGSRFAALNEMEKGIKGVMDNSFDGKDKVNGVALEREDNVADFVLKEDKIKGKEK